MSAHPKVKKRTGLNQQSVNYSIVVFKLLSKSILLSCYHEHCHFHFEKTLRICSVRLAWSLFHLIKTVVSVYASFSPSNASCQAFSLLRSNISEHIVDKEHYKWNFPLAFGVQPKRQKAVCFLKITITFRSGVILTCLFLFRLSLTSIKSHLTDDLEWGSCCMFAWVTFVLLLFEWTNHSCDFDASFVSLLHACMLM